MEYYMIVVLVIVGFCAVVWWATGTPEAPRHRPEDHRVVFTTLETNSTRIIVREINEVPLANVIPIFAHQKALVSSAHGANSPTFLHVAESVEFRDLLRAHIETYMKRSAELQAQIVRESHYVLRALYEPNLGGFEFEVIMIPTSVVVSTTVPHLWLDDEMSPYKLIIQMLQRGIVSETYNVVTGHFPRAHNRTA
jgi:hypothetical protein